METGTDIWTHTNEKVAQLDLIGYSVEATDGSIGKIDEATNDVGGSYIIVDTGPWIFGKHVVLPAGVIDHVDTQEKNVYVSRTKDEIKDAPEYDPDRGIDDTYRTEVGGYYGGRRS
jgi:hypothetical protein